MIRKNIIIGIVLLDHEKYCFRDNKVSCEFTLGVSYGATKIRIKIPFFPFVDRFYCHDGLGYKNKNKYE